MKHATDPKGVRGEITHLWSFSAGIAATVVFLFTTFATIHYVDGRTGGLDRKIDWIMDRVWEMSGRKGEPPPREYPRK